MTMRNNNSGCAWSLEARNALSIAFTLTMLLGAQAAKAQTAIPPAATDFAVGAVQSDEYEIDAARIAVAQSQNPQIRAFAQKMIEDHMRMGAGMRQAAKASGLPPLPHAMSNEQALMLAALQNLRNSEFDRTYMRQQVLAHQQALAVEQSYAEAGTDESLRSTARRDVPVIQHHLQTAQEMRSAVGGS